MSEQEPTQSHDLAAREVELVEARLSRAGDHCREFGRFWADYLQQRLHSMVRDARADGTVTSTLARAIPIPTSLSLEFGEAVYELRAALDNCLYAVAVVVSGQNPPPNAQRLEWPIRANPAEWESQRSRLRELPSEIVDALEAIQPYKAECPDWNCLKILHDLARVDRHRAAHALGLYVASVRVRFDVHEVAVEYLADVGIVQEGETLARLRLADGVSLTPENFDLNLEFDVDVADIVESVGPNGGNPSRPWGTLDKRLYALLKAVHEYADGLLAIAADLSATSDASA